MPPLVSIILPLYNGRAFIGETLSSLEAQTLQDGELIIVDDGSGDGGDALAEEICAASAAPLLRSLRLVRQANTGVAGARNHGLALATGRYVALLDQDDLWLPGRLAAMTGLLAERKARWGYSAFVRFYNDGREVVRDDGSADPGETLLKLVGGGLFIPPAAALVERELVGEIGGFVPEFAPSDDWDFFLKLAEREPGAYTRERLVRFRSHKTSTGKRQRAGIFRAQEAVLDLHEETVRPLAGEAAVDRRRSAINFHLAQVAWGEGDRKEAKRRFQAAVAANPRRFKVRWHYLKFLLGLKP